VNGFSLVEVVVSAAITGLVILGVANLWGQSSKMFQQLRQRNSQEALIEEDIATMEDLAYRYTCCPGSCTIDPRHWYGVLLLPLLQPHCHHHTQYRCL
jgi:type II secretory pathway pseudopilin PulG